MKKNNKIGIVIDYCLREPLFIEAYFAFFGILKKIYETEFVSEGEVVQVMNEEGEIEIKPQYNSEMYWLNELKKEGVFSFYTNKINEMAEIEELENSKLSLEEIITYFYNEEHYEKFMAESSYIMYSKAEKFNRDFFTYLNLMSLKFSIELLDISNVSMKRNSTITFLSKNPIKFNSLVFLNNIDEIDEDEYVWVYNNFKNEKTMTSEEFLETLKEVERKYDESNGLIGTTDNK